VRPASGPSARSTAAWVADPARDRLVLMGGQVGDFASDEAWAFSLATHEWHSLPTAPSGGRFDLGATTDGGRAWFFGGFSTDEQGHKQAHNDLWELDLATDTWRLLPAGGTPPAPTTNFGFAHHAGAL